jgi:sulfite exporter TauE/SafE
MNLEPLTAAFLVGLLGSTHCVGMCGGIVGALSAGLSAQARASKARLLVNQLAYNAGRMGSYAVAGMVAGALGQQATTFGLLEGFPLGRIIAGAVMILMGLYLGGWWHALQVLERLGARLWKRIEPIGRHFIPVHRPDQAFALGLVWGWLPCGLVYSALALAWVGGSGGQGATIMLAFGLGTLPTLLALGVSFEVLGRWVRDVRVRRLAGVLVILLGLAMLLAIGGQQGHHAHPHP